MKQDAEKEEDKVRPRHSHRDWEAAIDKQIREAIERGDFENLSGHGKPLDLSRDPNVPADWELAFKILKDAGYAPDWIELDKEIRTRRANLYTPWERYLKRARREPRREEQLTAIFRQEAVELNRLIDIFNLKSPTPRLHHTRIRVDEEVKRFQEECTKLI